MYSPNDIKWIKNVKRNQGVGIAYGDVSCGENFKLNWPTWAPQSPETPDVGDIIVLFQRPDFVEGRKTTGVLLTHLVGVMTDQVTIDEEHPQHQWCREVKLLAKADPIDALVNPGYFNFHKPNRGLTNPIGNLGTTIEMSEAELKLRLWELFYDYMCPDVADDVPEFDFPAGSYGESEGDRVIREHVKQEIVRRNSAIVREAKNRRLKRDNGRLICECCSFDFLEYYGDMGYSFIECHHKIPIVLGKRITKVTDLALVCSNCHRMLHRKLKDGTYHSVKSLKELIRSGA